MEKNCTLNASWINSKLFRGITFVCVQLYEGDLESEFSEFQDWLQIFPLYKGQAITEDDEEDNEERLMGKYKVMLMQLFVFFLYDYVSAVSFFIFIDHYFSSTGFLSGISHRSGGQRRHHMSYH